MTTTSKQTEDENGGVLEAKRRPPCTAELSDVVGEPSLRGSALALGDIFPLLDMVGGRCAAVYVGGSVVTGCFDRVLVHAVALHGDVVTAIASIVTLGARSLLLRIDAFAEPRTITPESVDGVSNASSRIPLVRYGIHKYHQHPCTICVFSFILHDFHGFRSDLLNNVCG